MTDTPRGRAPGSICNIQWQKFINMLHHSFLNYIGLSKGERSRYSRMRIATYIVAYRVEISWVVLQGTRARGTVGLQL